MKMKAIKREHYNQKGQEKEGRRGGGGRRAGGRGERSKGQGSELDAEKAERAEWNEIPFSWVIRGRQESHLIDQQVRPLLFRTAFLWEESWSPNWSCSPNWFSAYPPPLSVC